jgi:hypothetical protein
LISASTGAAAALSRDVPAGADVVADADAAGGVAGLVPDSDPDSTAEEGTAVGDAEGPGVAWCARLAALCGGIVTTTGDAAMAISDWLPGQEPAPAHPAAVLPARPVACPAAGPAERAPRVR